MLKEINSAFTEREEDDQPVGLSLIIDENLVNSIFYDWVLVEKSFSAREFLKMDPRYAGAADQLITNNFAMILPQILEDFGSDKNVDVMASLSHALIADKLEGTKPTGFQIDKNGNFRFIANISIQLLIEKF